MVNIGHTHHIRFFTRTISVNQMFTHQLWTCALCKIKHGPYDLHNYDLQVHIHLEYSTCIQCTKDSYIPFNCKTFAF